MSTNITNPVGFLRTTRSFPEDLHQLCLEVNRAYLDTANAVNTRTIGLYPTGKPSQTGESYFITTNQRQQTLRQVYSFTSTASINHGIQFDKPSQFTSCFGSYTDGTNSYGLIFATSVAIAGQIGFYMTPTQIVFTVGAGAPALTQGTIVLTWLVNP